MGGKTWKKEEVSLLIETYPCSTNEELMDLFPNRNLKTIIKKASELKIKKNIKVCIDNCLQTLFPKIAAEWHPFKNGNLTPSDVTARSGKKVWWLCEKGHEWEASVHTRTDARKPGKCPYCDNFRVCVDNCLQTLFPKIAAEWHPTKNIPLTPSDVVAGNNKIFWWLCEKGHEWQASLNSRTGNYKPKCPYCTNQKVCIDNCLQTLFPEIAAEWHPFKNGNLTPSEIIAGSAKKVWWLCKKGHEWEASLSKRIRGTGCPQCSQYKSEEEFRIILQKKTGLIFEKIKPKWLFNPETNKLLELDGLIKVNIKYRGKKYKHLAFECNGPQHYRYIHFFHRSKERFEDQLWRDRLKKSMCIQKEILLLEFDLRKNINKEEYVNKMLAPIFFLN